MKLSELFNHSGLGVMSTSSANGSVNNAVYGRPHLIDETTLVWGMTDRGTYSNLAENPKAAYLFKLDGPGFCGVRLSLELMRTEEEGSLLADIKKNTDSIVGSGAGDAVTHAVWFKVTHIRALI